MRGPRRIGRRGANYLLFLVSLGVFILFSVHRLPHPNNNVERSSPVTHERPIVPSKGPNEVGTRNHVSYASSQAHVGGHLSPNPISPPSAKAWSRPSVNTVVPQRPHIDKMGVAQVEDMDKHPNRAVPKVHDKADPNRGVPKAHDKAGPKGQVKRYGPSPKEREKEREEDKNSNHFLQLREVVNPPSHKRSRYAYVCVISNEKYVEGAVNMAWTIRKHSNMVRNSSADMVVMLNELVHNNSVAMLSVVGWN